MHQERLQRTPRPSRRKDRAPATRLNVPRGGPDPELDEELLARIEQLVFPHTTSAARG